MDVFYITKRRLYLYQYCSSDNRKRYNARNANVDKKTDVKLNFYSRLRLLDTTPFKTLMYVVALDNYNL